MGLSSVPKHLVGMLKHPNEYRAMVLYKVWRDPLHTITEDPEASGWVREDMQRCYYFLDMTSRSFAAVIKELDPELCRVITLFYLVLRGLDTVEDDMSLPLDVKVPVLESFHEKLYEPGWTFTQSGPNEKDRQLLVEFDVVIKEFGLLGPEYQKAIKDVAKSMGEGMARYATLHANSPSAHSVTSMESFDLYCHYVAGLVGEGLSALFSASKLESPMLGLQLSLSNAMGLLLQKTNITRDFCEDAHDGRVFWPSTIWNKYAASPKELLTAPNRLWALSEMVVDALTHATDALDYLTLLRNQSVFNFCAIPQVMAIATLNACFMNPKVYQENVKIRKGQAVTLILAATNPRDVAYIFRDEMRAIHARAVSSDPSFLKICILAGRIEQWTESHYPSFVIVGQPAIESAADWQPGMDARIKQLTGPLDPAMVEAKERAAAIKEGAKLTSADIKFLVLVMLGIFGVIAVMCAIFGTALYFLLLREGAPYYEGPSVVETTLAAVASGKHRIAGEL